MCRKEIKTVGSRGHKQKLSDTPELHRERNIDTKSRKE
jgi:hypothetical protein